MVVNAGRPETLGVRLGVRDQASPADVVGADVPGRVMGDGVRRYMEQGPRHAVSPRASADTAKGWAPDGSPALAECYVVVARRDYGLTLPTNVLQLASWVRVPPQVESASHCASVQVCAMYSVAYQIEPSASATAAE